MQLKWLAYQISPCHPLSKFNNLTGIAYIWLKMLHYWGDNPILHNQKCILEAAACYKMSVNNKEAGHTPTKLPAEYYIIMLIGLLSTFFSTQPWLKSKILTTLSITSQHRHQTHYWSRSESLYVAWCWDNYLANLSL